MNAIWHAAVRPVRLRVSYVIVGRRRSRVTAQRVTGGNFGQGDPDAAAVRFVSA